MLLLHLYVPFSNHGAFTNVQVTHDSWALTHPHIFTDPNNLNGPFPLQCGGHNINDFSPHSLNLLILEILDGEIHKFFATVHQETLFSNCWTICLHSFSQSDLAGEKLSLLRTPLQYLIMIISPFINLSVECSRGCLSIPQLSQSFIALSQLFPTCCRHQIQNECLFYKKQLSLNITYLVFVACIYAVKCLSKLHFMFEILHLKYCRENSANHIVICHSNKILCGLQSLFTTRRDYISWSVCQGVLTLLHL